MSTSVSNGLPVSGLSFFQPRPAKLKDLRIDCESWKNRIRFYEEFSQQSISCIDDDLIKNRFIKITKDLKMTEFFFSRNSAELFSDTNTSFNEAFSKYITTITDEISPELLVDKLVGYINDLATIFFILSESVLDETEPSRRMTHYLDVQFPYQEIASLAQVCQSKCSYWQDSELNRISKYKQQEFQTPD